MGIHDFLDLRSFVENIQGFHVGDQIDRYDLSVTQPIQCHVPSYGETESAHRTNVRLRCFAGYQQSGVCLLQQLFNVGGVACISIQAGTQDTFELESVEEKTILYFCHARPRLTRSPSVSLAATDGVVANDAVPWCAGDRTRKE